MTRRLLLLVSLCLVALLLALYPSWRRRTVVVGPGLIKTKLLCRAVVEPADGVAQVGVRLDGQVAQVLVRIGDTVQAGQLLAEIDDGEVRAEAVMRAAEKKTARYLAHGVAEGASGEERDIAKAEFEAAQLDFQREERRRQRAVQLQTSGVATADEVESSEKALAMARAHLRTAEDRMRLLLGGRRADVKAARSRVAAADAAVRMVTERLRYSRISAPIHGVIIERRIDPGDIATRGHIAFEIANPENIEARLEIADYNLTKVQVGQPVEFLLHGKAVATGSLRRVSAQLSRRSIGLDDALMRNDVLVGSAWAALGSQSIGLLRLGTRLEAVVGLAPVEAKARAPKSAVRVEDGQPVVTIPAGLLSKTLPVSIGAVDEDSVEVLGIDPGTQLLVD